MHIIGWEHANGSKTKSTALAYSKPYVTMVS